MYGYNIPHYLISFISPSLLFFADAWMKGEMKWRDTNHAWLINTLRPRHFPDDIFKYILNLLNENAWSLLKISRKFVPKVQMNNFPALVQIMAWCRSNDKPLSEPMMAQYTDVYMRHSASIYIYICIYIYMHIYIAHDDVIRRCSHPFISS